MKYKSPREKAKELVDIFYKEVKYIERAKQCALIAVDEIIKTYDCTMPQSTEYWQEVKQEIEKL